LLKFFEYISITTWSETLSKLQVVLIMNNNKIVYLQECHFLSGNCRHRMRFAHIIQLTLQAYCASLYMLRKNVAASRDLPPDIMNSTLFTCHS
jgi:hypothetical protein